MRPKWDAAVKATQLAQKAYDYTTDKFNLGTADTFLVVQYGYVAERREAERAQCQGEL